jgi:hypothetical protein
LTGTTFSKVRSGPSFRFVRFGFTGGVDKSFNSLASSGFGEKPGRTAPEHGSSKIQRLPELKTLSGISSTSSKTLNKIRLLDCIPATSIGARGEAHISSRRLTSLPERSEFC